MIPKFEALSETYASKAVCAKCLGDENEDSAQLLSREGVRSVPVFHFWKGGKKVETLIGANIQQLEDTIKGFL
jgi:thioredoxin 1